MGWKIELWQVPTRLQWDCLESAITRQSTLLQKIVPALLWFWWIVLWSTIDCNMRPILEQLGTFVCNLWITQDFVAIRSISLRSCIVLQSHRNSIWYCRLRSELAPRGPWVDCAPVPLRWIAVWLLSDCDCGAILGQLLAFDCNPRSNPSELYQDCLEYAIDPQSTGLQNTVSRLWQDCEEPEKAVSVIAGHWEDCGGPPDKDRGRT